MQCKAEKSSINMGKRRSDLLELSSYIQTVDNDVTMILQSLQWDRKHLIEASPMVSCQYNRNHRVPPDKQKDHEKECYLRSLGYSKEDLLLPEPLDETANTLVALNQYDIANIIEYAAKIDPGFKKGRGGEPTGLLSLERLQQAYSADERRALHDAAVHAAPACHDLGELALLGGDEEAQSSKQKSRAEILSELRDMKRRRAKYRVAAKTRNYSAVLRDVIATQMEHYSEAQNGDPSNNSDTLNKSRKKEPLEQDKSHLKEKETQRNSETENRYRDRSSGESRHRFSTGDKTRYRASSRDERHRGPSADEKRHRDSSRDKNRHRDSSRDENRHRDSSRDENRHRDSSRDENRHRDSSRDENRRRDNFRDEMRHRENSRDETRQRDKFRDESLHTSSCRERYKDKERQDDYKRHNPRDDERRRRDDGDKHSSSYKDRSKDKRDYRTRERYRDDSRDVKKEYKSSRDSEVKYKREDDSYEKSDREDKHKRYYDYKQDEFEVSKRIKQEKD